MSSHSQWRKETNCSTQSSETWPHPDIRPSPQISGAAVYHSHHSRDMAIRSSAQYSPGQDPYSDFRYSHLIQAMQPATTYSEDRALPAYYNPATLPLTWSLGHDVTQTDGLLQPHILPSEVFQSRLLANVPSWAILGSTQDGLASGEDERIATSVPQSETKRSPSGASIETPRSQELVQTPTTRSATLRSPVRKKKPSRSRPFDLLDGQRKQRVTRDSPSCWRCRKYKKPCDDEQVCNSCLTGNFRVWPSHVGCRRDSLVDFTTALFPMNVEQVLLPIALHAQHAFSWRSHVQHSRAWLESEMPVQYELSHGVRNKVRSTGMYATETDELFDIVACFQNTQNSRNPLLEAACATLKLSCDFYSFFIVSPAQGVFPTNTTASQFSKLISDLRVALCKSFRLFVSHCLSRDRADWFPAIVAISLVGIAITVVLDAAYVVPEPVRALAWPPDIYTACAHIRGGVMSIVMDLMRARADDDTIDGPRPLRMDCWGTIPPVSSVEMLEGAPARNPTGMALVNYNVAAFDGFAHLQAWTVKHRELLLSGRSHFSIKPFSRPDLPPISNISTLWAV